MNVEQIHIEYVAEDGVVTPERAHADDAAFDLRAYLPQGPTCEFCDGSGQVEDESDPMHGQGVTIVAECYECDGLGYAPPVGELYLEPHGTCLVPTGLRIALPAGVAAFVLPRSGLALKNSITVLNAPGLIDPGYRGEVGVVLHNAGSLPFIVHHQDRIAQLLPFRLSPASFFRLLPTDHGDDCDECAAERAESAFHEKAAGRESGERGEGGFGSTGL